MLLQLSVRPHSPQKGTGTVRPLSPQKGTGTAASSIDSGATEVSITRLESARTRRRQEISRLAQLNKQITLSTWPGLVSGVPLKPKSGAEKSQVHGRGGHKNLLRRPGTANDILSSGMSANKIQCSRVGATENERPMTSGGLRKELSHDRLGLKKMSDPAKLLQKFTASPSYTFESVEAEINISLDSGKNSVPFCICKDFYFWQICILLDLHNISFNLSTHSPTPHLHT